MSDDQRDELPLAQVRREWPWGLVVWADAESRESPGEHFDANGVAAASSVIVTQIIHEVDGEGIAELRLTEPPRSALCIYDNPFDCSSGRLVIGDAANAQTIVAEIPAGAYRARVCVDQIDHPEAVALYLTPM